ncbi:MAG: PQQ-binding-like beta-propeller repeat protein, partial [Longimicrobiales bacterium]
AEAARLSAARTAMCARAIPFAPVCLVVCLVACWTPPRAVPALPAPLPAQGEAFATTEFPDASAPENPVEAWRIDAGRGFLGAPRVRAHVAVAAHTGRDVTVRETADGEIYWRRRFRTPITGLTVADGVVYFAERASRGTVHALALTDGAEQWTARVRHARHAPVTIDGLVVFSTDAGELVAFDNRGEVSWQTPLGGVLALAPAHAFAGLAAATIGDTLYFVAGDGSITDRAPLPATPSAPLLATQDGLVLPLHDGSIVTIENDHTLGQRVDVGDVVLAQPVHDDRGGIVVLTRAGKLWRITGRTLAPVADLASAATRSLVRVANGYVVGLLDGTVALVGDDGTVRWRYAAQESVDEPVAVEHDALYIATRRGTLIKLVAG